MAAKTSFPHLQPNEIIYTTACFNWGQILVATTARGICSVQLGDRSERSIEILIAELSQKFGQTAITREDLQLKPWLNHILKPWSAIVSKQEPAKSAQLLPLDIGSTAFQQRVWQALRAIPYGETRTYQEIATQLGQPNATRAIGSACGANPVALIIPCHRIVRSDGKLGGYRWGIELKQKLIELEVAQAYPAQQLTLDYLGSD